MKTPLIKWAIMFMAFVFAQHIAFTYLFPDALKKIGLEKGFAALTFPEKKTTTTIDALDGEVIVPLEKRGGGWVIHVELNSLYEANLIVDTGATITSLSEDLAFDMGLTPDPYYAPVSFQTANGTTKAWISQVRTIRAGDATQQNFMVAINDFSNFSKGRISGLLGLNFLNKFDWRLDQANEVLILKAKT